jgi:transposase
MHSMTQQDTVVVGGVDAHADTHHAAALDQRGARLDTKSFPTTTPGYGQLLDWLSGFGIIDAIAIESTGSYAAALVRYLREHEIQVIEVNQPHAHTRRRVGKSDPIDAEMAARLFLAGKAKAVPKRTDGIVESIRLLRAARHSAVKSRSAAIVQLRDIIITAPQELRDQLFLPHHAPRQSYALRAISAIGPRAALPLPSREVRPALDRPTDRVSRS